MIRQNDNIHGISLAGEHKIALFANDVLVFLSRPISSLPALMQTLSDFGSISGYKLNSHKSQMLTFKYTTSQKFRDKYAINEVNKLNYLGVKISKDLTSLTSDNYDPLLSNIRKDLDRWNLLPFLGLIQRVEIIKLNVLPRLLYLFQSLPVEIPEKKFAE